MFQNDHRIHFAAANDRREWTDAVVDTSQHIETFGRCSFKQAGEYPFEVGATSKSGREEEGYQTRWI